MQQQKDSERWEVIVGKDRLILNGLEVEAIKKAQAQGLNMVWFRDLCINTNFISTIKLLNPTKVELDKLSAPPMSEQDRAKIRERIGILKKKLSYKMSMDV